MSTQAKWLVGVGIVAFLIGAGVGGFVVKKATDTPSATTGKTRVAAAYTPVGEPQAGTLADRFRPWLLFDGPEQWRPVSLAALFAERDASGAPAQQFCRRGQTPCTPVGSEAEFAKLVAASSTFGQDTYLDLAGRTLDDFRAPHGGDCGHADCGTAPASAIYYRVTAANNRFYIDYWWFLRFNDFYKHRCGGHSQACDQHEGDWEGMTVVTVPGQDTRLDYAVYAVHREAFRYAAAQLQLMHGRRPVVYVARGSHAAYPKACATIACQQPIAVLQLANLPEGRFKGDAPWERNGESCGPDPKTKAPRPGSCLLPLPRPETDPQAWTVWPGLWGATCSERCGTKPGAQSPASPGLQSRYQTPWCSVQNDILTCDGVAQGCADWLGALVAAVVCDPARLGKQLVTADQAAKTHLAIVVTRAARSGPSTAEKVAATTVGVVQDIGEPLPSGSRVTIAGPTPRGTQVLVRAVVGITVLEARFDDVAIPQGARRTIAIGGRRRPTARLLLPGGRTVEPVDQRLFRVPAVSANPTTGGRD